jgi:hypothetical protein
MNAVTHKEATLGTEGMLIATASAASLADRQLPTGRPGGCLH